MPFSRVTGIDGEEPKFLAPATEARPAQPKASEHNAEALERGLLLAFVMVAVLTMLWHLGMSLEWLWTNCVSHLHSAVAQAGAF